MRFFDCFAGGGGAWKEGCRGKSGCTWRGDVRETQTLEKEAPQAAVQLSSQQGRVTTAWGWDGSEGGHGALLEPREGDWSGGWQQRCRDGPEVFSQ